MDRLRLWLLTLLLAVSIVFVVRFSSIMGIFLFSIGMAYVLMPAVNGAESMMLKHSRYLKNKNRARVMAVILIMLLVVLAVVIGIGTIAPYLSHQITGLIADFPKMRVGLENYLQLLNERLTAMNLPDSLTATLESYFNEIDSYLVSAAWGIVSWLAQAGSGVMNLVIIIILQIYFLMDGPRMIKLGREYLLNHQLNRIADFLHISVRIISRYLKNQVLISGCMALVAFLGMRTIGVGYAGLFALMLFVVDFIPYIGPIVGTVVVIAFALLTISVKTAVAAGIFLLLLQQLEGNVLAPRIQGKSIGVHAAFIILSLLVCFELWGPVGMLFATVLAGMVKMLLSDVMEFLTHPGITIGQFLRMEYGTPTPEPPEPEDAEGAGQAEEKNFSTD